MKPILSSLIALALLLTSVSVQSKPSNLTSDQKTFLNAYDAIKANDRPLIAQYKKQLKDYPLYPYLQYLDYKYHFDQTPESLIENFLLKTPNSPLPGLLKSKWLRHLGKTKQWNLYLKHYDANTRSSTLKCYFVRANIAKKRDQSVQKLAQSLWSDHITLPKACKPLDKYLRNKKLVTGSMVWKKVQLAMKKGKTKSAKRIARDLSRKDQKALDYWISVYKKPAKVDNKMPSTISPVVKKQIFKQGVKRLSYSKPELALSILKNRAEQYGVKEKQLRQLSRQISLRFAYKYHPKAKQYLAQLDKAAKDTKVLDWEMQVAIRESDWVHYLDLYSLLPAKQKNKNRWRYWRARAMTELNQEKEAQPIFKALAKNRNFYGFMSADFLGLPYQFNPAPSQKADLDRMKQTYPQLHVMEELLAIDWNLSLRREWNHLLKTVKRNDFEAIANFMADWNQHNLAIQTVSKVKKWDVLSLRFPTPYKEPIMKAANHNTIDPAWVYGVIRRESAFSPTISSSVGAVGLMQLMPGTARYIGRKIGLKKHQYTRLTHPESNIKLGSAYLSYLDAKYDGNRILATAAYNAGPSRVDQWIPKDKTISADQWIDTIPFSETRAYVKAVMEYTTIFKSLLNKKYDRLENFMQPIGKTQKVAKTKAIQPKTTSVKAKQIKPQPTS